MKKFLIAISILAGTASAAYAADETSQLTVSATYSEGCHVSWQGAAQGGNLAFPVFSDPASLGSKTASFLVSCSDAEKTVPIELSAGTGNSTAAAKAAGLDAVNPQTGRAMINNQNPAQDNTAPLLFNVYIGDNANGVVWGDKASTGGAQPYNAVVSSSSGAQTQNFFTVQVYPSQPNFKGVAGQYTSTMIATVDYPANGGGTGGNGGGNS